MISRSLHLRRSHRTRLSRTFYPDTNIAMAYRVAAASGFRANELRSLPPERFRLDGDHPSIILKPPDAKNRRGVEQPIPRALADRLGRFLAGKPWGSPCSRSITRPPRRSALTWKRRNPLQHRSGGGGLPFPERVLHQCVGPVGRVDQDGPNLGQTQQPRPDPGPLRQSRRSRHHRGGGVIARTDPKGTDPRGRQDGGDRYGWSTNKRTLCPLFAHRRGRNEPDAGGT